MNKILQILIKELLLYWFVASVIMLLIITMSTYYTSLTLAILTIISTIISKIIYENYVSKFYTQYNKPKTINYYDGLEK